MVLHGHLIIEDDTVLDTTDVLADIHQLRQGPDTRCTFVLGLAEARALSSQIVNDFVKGLTG